MKTKSNHPQVIALPRGRRVMMNMLNLTEAPHNMYGLLEVDVTLPRQLIARHRQLTGEKLSFTGFLTFCLARAVDENREVQAYLKGRKQLVLFEDVDVGIIIENTQGEKPSLIGYVIHCANRKTFRQIHDEIRSVQFSPPSTSRGIPPWFSRAMLLPWPLSWMVKKLIQMATRNDPAFYTTKAGTVGISSVGMFGGGHSGWGIYPQAGTLSLIVGSLSWKPAVVEGRIEPREILNLTIVFDHEVIDGAPAARFTRRLVDLIESGYGLEMEQIQAPAGAGPEIGEDLR